MIWLLGVTILMMFKSNPPVCQSILCIYIISSCSKAGPSVTSKLPFSVSSLALQVYPVHTVDYKYAVITNTTPRIVAALYC